jgi:PAS domain S-box-containing protein
MTPGGSAQLIVVGGAIAGGAIAGGETAGAHGEEPWGAPEIGEEIGGASVARVSVDRALDLPRPSAIVFDLRSTELRDLSVLRQRPPFASVPLLVISIEPLPESVLADLRVDDDWTPAAGIGRLRRRVERLLELDRLRVDLRREVDDLHRVLVDKQRFDHAILDGVDVGIVTTDRNGTITFLNRAATDLLGSARAIHGASVREVLDLTELPGELLAGESRRLLTYTLHLAEEARLDLQLLVSRGSAADQDRVGFFFIFHDVQEENQREAERQRFERLAAMGTMVAGFAHEVRNPIAAMRSIVEELREEGVETPHVGLLLRMVARIERLVRTSLQFGRPAAPKRAPRQPAVIVTAALSELVPELRGSKAPVVVEIESGLSDVVVDESQIAQALVILINNAVDSTGDPARVILRACRAKRPDSERRRSDPPLPPAVRFEVVDDGPGIRSDLLERIFDPFFTTKPAGTGLGLSIAQQIVSENGGRLEVVSQLGGPTSFSIVVPVSSAHYG